MSIDEGVLMIYILWFRDQHYTQTSVTSARDYLMPRLQATPPCEHNVKCALRWWDALPYRVQGDLSRQYDETTLEIAA